MAAPAAPMPPPLSLVCRLHAVDLLNVIAETQSPLDLDPVERSEKFWITTENLLAGVCSAERTPSWSAIRPMTTKRHRRSNGTKDLHRKQQSSYFTYHSKCVSILISSKCCRLQKLGGYLLPFWVSPSLPLPVHVSVASMQFQFAVCSMCTCSTTRSSLSNCSQTHT